eukprot:m.921627 g.921627  ORF g.921627 m.921627 type:complete len:413 (+) comp87512_c0_seq1:117-1355(+)
MVVLRRLHLLEDELHRLDLVHVVEELPQDPALLQDLRLEQQLFTARAGLVDQQRRVDALLGHAAVQVDFAVAGALELFVDHFVHLGAGVDQRGTDDGQRAAFLDVARRAEEALGALQRVGVHTTGQHLAGAGQHVVVGTGQAGDRVQQDDHVLLQLDQALGALDDHLGHLHVAGGGLVEGGADDLTAHGADHFRHFLGALVDEQHDEVAVRMVGHQRVRQALHHLGLARLGLRHDQRALAFADGRHQVDDATGDVLFALVAFAFELELLLGEQGRQVLEHDLVLALLRRLVVDAVNLDQGEVALAVFGHAHFTFHQVTGVQVEAADLARAQVDVVGRRHVAGFDRAQEAEAVGEHFEHAITEDLLASLGALLHDGEHQLLLAQAGDVVDLQLLAHLDESGDVERFEFGKMHG